MPPSFEKHLVVIGAGPKGLAIAIKSKVLREFGLESPSVTLIEKNAVASHWTGCHGFTNGDMLLGTNPEKDLVFPLETEFSNPHLTQLVRSRLLQFTWTAYLANKNKLSDWIDRGRPAPSHRVWGQYLTWASEQLSPEVKIISGTVEQLDVSPDSQNWSIKIRLADNCVDTIKAHGVVLTGPASSRKPEGGIAPDAERHVFDIETFWRHLKAKALNLSGTLAIVGAGENAASILVELSKSFPKLDIEIISSNGFVSTRAENFYENRIYSNPDHINWQDLSNQDRKNFIQRTDVGVFSAEAMKLLNSEKTHKILPGRVIKIENESHKAVLSVTYAGHSSKRSYDHVILATGFDFKKSISSMLSSRTISLLGKSGVEIDHLSNIEDLIGHDLAVLNFEPKLYVPMLSAMAQGPGFANLSCLGRLSDRILMGNVGSQTPRSERLL